MTFASYERLMFFIEEFALARYKEGACIHSEEQRGYWNDFASMIHNRVRSMLMYYVPEDELPKEDEDV